MNAEIELTVDDSGNPVIDIKHHDKSNALIEKLIGVFVKGAIEHGLIVHNPRGYVEVGGDSWEIYRIRVAK